MDIQILGNSSLKIKSKKTTLAVDPKTSISKFDADAVLVTDKESDTKRIDNFRVIINSVGEYEISGLKISGIKVGTNVMFGLTSENANALITKASQLENISTEKLGEYKIAIINADAKINQSILTSLEPSVVVLYGENAKEEAKAMGKENAVVSSKISISEDKLPEEMDVMVLSWFLHLDKILNLS